ncbi:hypothetical protein HMN09_01384700 [Mycena chlorophos]|uniref:Uncharacterized protein n=1 Tax=Mycena chlorophos TaxID=658473 RepID=A0A8H6VQR1_MYCCL|nr:hypothetical protein HMN09_01384700 [Mycena chlorophos]
MIPSRFARPPRLRTFSTAVDPAAYCQDLVRKHDYDSFLVGKFWAGPLQASYFALKAFSTELAMVQDTVSNATIGAMRMQFWRDAIRDIFADKPPRHPIALALHQATKTADIPAYYLKRIVDARDAELRSASMFQTSGALEGHAESVSSSLLYLLLALKGLGGSETLAHAASHLGTAQTVATLLRGLPYHASRRHLPLPLDICARHGVKQEEVFRHGGDASGIDAAVYDVAVLANDHLLTARDMFKESGGKVPGLAMPVFLAAVPVASFLEQLERANFDVFDKSLAVRDWRGLGPSDRRCCDRSPSTLPRPSSRERPPSFTPLMAPPATESSRVSSPDMLVDESLPPVPPNFFDDAPEEVIQLLIFSLHDPSAFSAVNTRLHRIARTPWVVAQYFMQRHGKIEALFHALGRGRLLSPEVLNILLASGAVLSRYLVQVAFHHFFFTSSHFLKPSTPWVRSMSLAHFSHFLAVAAERLGDIPRGKAQDDGSVLMTFLKDAKLQNKRISFEQVRDIFEKYHFMPFHNRDPLMTQLPLVLAVEPRLLPCAVANGFYMDSKYRDFVFRKMFENSEGVQQQEKAIEIADKVRDLCNLDASMFLSRTVAAEVLLESETNEAGYKALKRLDRSGDLEFPLTDLVKDVVKLFMKARAITTSSTRQILTKLYTDFLAPSPGKGISLDPLVRRAMLLTVFAADPPVSIAAIPERLKVLDLGPLSLDDGADVLLSAFVERTTPLFEYFRRQGVPSERGGTRKVTNAELRTLAEDVAVRCLTREQKGKTMKRLHDAYPSVKARVEAAVAELKVSLEDLEGGEIKYASLARSSDYWAGVSDESDTGSESEDDDDEDEEDDAMAVDEEGWSGDDDETSSTNEESRDLGSISLEPLSVMLRRDENSQRQRTRRRRHYFYSNSTHNGSRRPANSESVSSWIKSEFSPTSACVAQFLLHAVINGNSSVLSAYLLGPGLSSSSVVPVTFKHFQALAKMGKSSGDYYLFERIKRGAPFYATEDDYMSPIVKLEKDAEVKPEPSDAKLESRKRPRRSAATSNHSYTVPDSDDEAIADEDDLNDEFVEYRKGGAKRKRTVKIKEEEKPVTQSHLQRWIAALSGLHKEEEKKYREKKKKVIEEARAAGNTGKLRVPKNDFLRSLNYQLRQLRGQDEQERRLLAPAVPGSDPVDSDADDDTEYRQRPRKKRKTTTTTTTATA